MNTPALQMPVRQGLLAFAVAAVSLNAGAQTRPDDIKALLPDPAHRAIFCGDDGTETTQAYALAVQKAMNALVARDKTVDDRKALDLLKRALCAPAAKS